MEEKPLISVIIPTYKRKPKMINRSIQSVLNQTYSNIEVIVVDDSPDNYEHRDDVADYFENIEDSRINYYRHSENKGANIARNTGIKKSTGKYCAFLDDDDEWRLDKLELQYEEAIRSSAELVYCKALSINEINQSYAPLPSVLKRGNVYEDLLLRNIVGSNSFVLISRHALEKVSYYDEKMLALQDWDLFIRIAKEFTISYVDEFLVFYYIHSGERISTNQFKQLQGWNIMYEKNKNVIMKNSKLKNKWDTKLIPVYLKNKKNKRAFKQFLKTFSDSPLQFIKYIKGTLDYILNKPKPKKIENYEEFIRTIRKTKLSG